MSSYFDPARGQLHAFRAVRRSGSALTEKSPAYADLLCLEDFSDKELLHGLWARYEQKQIYTWLGDVLVSVNPYTNVGAFEEEVVARYSGKEMPKAPHLYAVVSQALAAEGKRHALLITGESGAGKTEATRAILSFLGKRQVGTNDVRDRLLRSTPVLEAFGNAHTRQNCNSSRFGKFIEVHLLRDEVVGATLTPYMLEASRVSGDLPAGERTYHIFYLLKTALKAFSKEVLAPSTPFWDRLAREKNWQELVHFGRLMATSRRLQDGPDSPESFEALVTGLLATGMKLAQVADCCRIVAAVALLSEPDLGEEALTRAAELLRIEEAALRSFLWRIMMSVGGERVFRERTKAEAMTLRASLAQELYAALFTWLTRFIGDGIKPRQEGERIMGLLDLYGFEVFPSNGFEQFLINYCNERLQQFFNRQVFAREAQEYAAEGLDLGHWSRCALACELPALSLLEGQQAVGVFQVVNDRSRCNFEEAQNGSGALAETLGVSCGSHAAFCRASGRDSSRRFGVKHFAGQVFYEAGDFVRKNASAHRPDICAFLREHGGDFVREVTEEVKDVAPKRGRKLFGRTLINIFQQELNELCATLEARDCRHIRCLRPNDEQKPMVFDDESMLRQCRYSGLLEATRIRRQGYAHRRSLEAFAARYAMLLSTPEAKSSARHAKDALGSCRAIQEVALRSGVPAEDLRTGRSKVFLRETALGCLEAKRSAAAAERLLTAMRGHVVRRRYARLRWLARRLQALARGRRARREARAAREGLAARQLQRFWRRRQARAARAMSLQCLPMPEVDLSTSKVSEPSVAPPAPRRHVGEVRVCAATCRQWTRPLRCHEIVRESRSESRSWVQVRAYLPGSAPNSWARPAVHVKPREASKTRSMWSPRTERPLVAVPAGISTVGAPPRASPVRPWSFTPGVVVPSWAWLSPREKRTASVTPPVLKALPTPCRSRSLQRPPLRSTLGPVTPWAITVQSQVPVVPAAFVREAFS